MPPTPFWQLSSEIDDYLTRHPDHMTQAGLMRLLKQCQAAARELWTEEANATLALDEAREQIAALKQQMDSREG